MTSAIWARCGACGHVFKGFDLPTPLAEAAKKMQALRCEHGCKPPLYVANDGDIHQAKLKAETP